MSHFPLTNVAIYLGQLNLSSDSNKIAVLRSQEGLDNTTFGGSFKARMPGLGDALISMAGLVELTTLGQEQLMMAGMSLSDVGVLISMLGASVGDRCKFAEIITGQYQTGGVVGARAEWSADGRISRYVLTDGNIMTVGAKTGTFNGAYQQLGAISATQKLYDFFSATALSAFTSATFKLQSADDAGGTNVTDRMTWSPTGLGYLTAAPVSGPITQQFWRCICSAFTGTSLTVVAGLGIQ